MLLKCLQMKVAIYIVLSESSALWESAEFKVPELPVSRWLKNLRRERQKVLAGGCALLQ